MIQQNQPCSTSVSKTKSQQHVKVMFRPKQAVSATALYQSYVEYKLVDVPWMGASVRGRAHVRA